MRQRLLGIGRQQPAAGLFILRALPVKKQQRSRRTTGKIPAGKGRGGGSPADDGNIVHHTVFS